MFGDVAAVRGADLAHALEFFGNLAESSPQSFRGTTGTQNSVELDDSWLFKWPNAAFGICHEFGHTLGFKEGPPKLQGILPESIWRYYYGNLNVMCQHYVPGESEDVAGGGIPPFGLHYLATTGWVPVVDFTGQNLEDVDLWDVRYRGEGEDPDEGAIYKFHNPGRPDEFFLVAYHSGMLVDAQADADRPYYIPGRGLQVVHVLDGTFAPKLVDIESAFGLYSGITDAALPEFAVPPLGGGWATCNTVRGFDNYDLWWINDDPRELRGLGGANWYGDYSLHDGRPYDFFTFVGGNPPNMWTTPEFSFRTNPSSLWYNAAGGYSDAEARFNPQDIPNSLTIHIEEQDDAAHRMIVDFLTAPGEELDFPPPHCAFLPVGEPQTIKWSDRYHEAYDRIVIYYSRINGEGWDYVGEIDGFAPQYVWTPAAADVAVEGRIKVVFHNTQTDLTYEAVSDPFNVGDGAVIYAEEVLAPTGGDVLFTDAPTEIRWTDYYPRYPGDVAFDHVDIWYRPNPEAASRKIGDYLEPVNDYSTSTDPETGQTYNWWAWTPQLELLGGTDATGEGEIEIRFFRNEVDWAGDSTDAQFIVLPDSFRTT